MNARWWSGLAVLGLLAIGAAPVGARPLNVEVWTDRGDDAVYRGGELLEVRARASEDAYLLVYEIDAEGYVRLLHPFRGSNGFVEGRRTYNVPPERANVDLVVEDGPVGQCYVVAIVSRERFLELPWYLHPYDLQAESVGYEGMRDDEEGITAEGRIVGDPFVAMEKIRRRVVADPENEDAFATAYTTYYVHEPVRYPRYLCYDCHRPGRWAWWPGFDPYYTHCSVFDFRINWGWGWGPGYWFGSVPYYYFYVRNDCPPYYRPWYGNRHGFSSWDGWRRWKSLWGDRLVRFKTPPPPGYVPPSKYPDRSTWRDRNSAPPGFLLTDLQKGRSGFQPRIPTGRGSEYRPRGEEGTGSAAGRDGRKPTADRVPQREVGQRREGSGSAVTPRGRNLPGRGSTPAPRREVKPREEQPRDPGPAVKPREQAPRQEKPREDPPPRVEKGRDRPSPKPAQETRGNGRPSRAEGRGQGRSRPRG